MRVYSIYGQDNDSYAFKRPGLARCRSCGLILDKWTTSLEGFSLTKRKLDVSYTYDGLLVASFAFVEFCNSSGFTNLKTRQLPSDTSFYALASDAVVKFDVERRGTRLLDFCAECGRHKTVAGATPVFLLPGEGVPDFAFARTDLEFGSGDEQHPLLLCGRSAGEVLETQTFRGLELRYWDF